MPTTTSLTLFIAAVAVLQITPGPDMMLVLARGIGRGRGTAVLTVIGMVAVAGTVQVGLLVFGLASLLQTYPLMLVGLRYGGGAYLFYLGGHAILSSVGRHPLDAPAALPIGRGAAVRDGAINSLTNPKSLLFMFAFLPQFVDPARPLWSQLLVLGAIQKLSGVVSLGAVALASGTIGAWLRRWPGIRRWQDRVSGVVMIGLGCVCWRAAAQDPWSRAAERRAWIASHWALMRS